MSWMTILDYFGLTVFAISGCMLAAEKRLDVIGFVFFAVATGIGGGTFRDMALGRLPVFWVQDATPLLLCSAVAVACFFTVHRIRNYHRALLWADALGMATFSVIGAQVATAQGANVPIALVMGVATACFGGVLRDVVAQHPSVLLQQEIYVTAALVGAASYLALLGLGMGNEWAAPLAIAAAFSVRGAAIHFNLRLPAFNCQ
jgi:uncharacterized membrane protein YeiH